MKRQHRFNIRPFILSGFVLLALPCLPAAGAGDNVSTDARLDFNRACAAAADGDGDLAVELFQKASASTDPRLAAAGRYCLGCLAAGKAKAVFGEKPQDAAPDLRREGLEHLDRAVAHYRDALKLDPQHEDTRYNLETIRHWVGQMNALWRQRDRRKKRDGLDLLDYVLMLEKEQQAIRGRSKTLGKQTDTPLWREQLDETRAAQQDLAREIEPLKAKIVAALSQRQGGPATMPTAEMQRAVALLSGLADRAGTEMTTAADQLHSARTSDALTAQAAAVEMLDQVYMAMVPYPGLVKRAVDTQRQLVDRTAGAVEPPEETGKDAAEKNTVDKSPEVDENHKFDHREARDPREAREEAWRQRFVTRWSEVLVAKAKQGLRQMPQQSDEGNGRAGPDDKAAAKPASGLDIEKKPASGLDIEKKPASGRGDKEKMEGLRRSMELAVKLGPKVETLTDEAATHLDEKQPAPALPKQKEALRLLEEIAKPLQDQNQDNKDQKDKDQKDKDKQDGKKQDNKDDKKKKDDKGKKDGKKQPQKKQADKSKDKQDKQKQKSQQPKQTKGQQGMAQDRKKAEAVLRRARQRQQERRELEKAVEAQLHRAGTVEKDW